jgi:hypothetical protein
MATIAGILTAPDGSLVRSGTLRFRLTSSPYDAAGAVHAWQVVSTITHPNTGAYSIELAPGVYRVNAAGTPEFTIQVPVGGGTFPLDDLAATFDQATEVKVLAWAMAEAFNITVPAYDADGVLASGPVIWPDGTPGQFNTTLPNVLFAVPDAYTVTYVQANTFTVTQPAVTRNTDGIITVLPAMTIATS